MDRHSAAKAPSSGPKAPPWWRDPHLLRGLGMALLLAIVAVLIHLGRASPIDSESGRVEDTAHESR